MVLPCASGNGRYGDGFGCFETGIGFPRESGNGKKAGDSVLTGIGYPRESGKGRIAEPPEPVNGCIEWCSGVVPTMEISESAGRDSAVSSDAAALDGGCCVEAGTSGARVSRWLSKAVLITLLQSLASRSATSVLTCERQ